MDIRNPLNANGPQMDCVCVLGSEYPFLPGQIILMLRSVTACLRFLPMTWGVVFGDKPQDFCYSCQNTATIVD